MSAKRSCLQGSQWLESVNSPAESKTGIDLRDVAVDGYPAQGSSPSTSRLFSSSREIDLSNGTPVCGCRSALALLRAQRPLVVPLPAPGRGLTVRIEEGEKKHHKQTFLSASLQVKSSALLRC